MSEAPDADPAESAIVQLLDRAVAVVERINHDEVQHGGLLSRESLKLVSLLKLELDRWGKR